MYAIMEGRAIRAGYLIDAPILKTVGGAVCTPKNRAGIEGFWVAAVTNLFGVPIIASRWRKRYLLDRVPENVEAPITPFSGG